MEYFPRVQHCCCCFGWSLKKGTLLIGTFLLIFYSLFAAFKMTLISIPKGNGTTNTSNPDSAPAFDDDPCTLGCPAIVDDTLTATCVDKDGATRNCSECAFQDTVATLSCKPGYEIIPDPGYNIVTCITMGHESLWSKPVYSCTIGEDKASVVQVAATYSIIFILVLDIIVNIVLIIGTLKNKPICLLVWLYCTMFTIVSHILECVFDVIEDLLARNYFNSILEVLYAVIGVAFGTYFVAVVNGYYQLLRRQLASARNIPVLVDSNHHETETLVI